MSTLEEVSLKSPSWKRPFLTHWLPLLLWMALIFILSHQDKNQTVQTSGFVLWLLSFLPLDPDWLLDPAFKVFVRKSAHTTEYMVLFLLMYRLLTWYQPHNEAMFSALFLSIVYAMTDEFHQTFVPGRGASVGDVCIDAMGACVGLLLIYLFTTHKKGRKNKEYT